MSREFLFHVHNFSASQRAYGKFVSHSEPEQQSPDDDEISPVSSVHGHPATAKILTSATPKVADFSQTILGTVSLFQNTTL